MEKKAKFYPSPAKIGYLLLYFIGCQVLLALYFANVPSSLLPKQTSLWEAVVAAKKAGQFASWSLAFFLVCWVPAQEETIFRLPLGQADFLPLSLSSLAATLLAAQIFPEFSQAGLQLFLYMLTIAGGSFLFYQLLTLARQSQTWQFSLPARTPSILFSSALFALLHLDKTSLVEPLLLITHSLPFFVLGLFFCRTRLRLGFGYGLALHSLQNFFAFLSCYWS